MQEERIKYKPYPLNTIKLQKLSSDYLNFPSDLTMKTAELLYNKGYISYPRTETNSFKKNTNFYQLVEIHKNNENLGFYANFLLSNKVYPPRDGDKNDNSHPPIYPCKSLPYPQDESITKVEATLYELIVRCFLASCSRDSFAIEKKYDIDIEGEPFYFKELQVKEENFLRIYPYDKWFETKGGEYDFQEGEILKNIKIAVKKGKTTPPRLLNESDLIDLMDKNGIGTDSTIHEHIKKIQDREYALKIRQLFHPTALGYALIESYEKLGLKLSTPNLRSEMEKGIKNVADGIEDKEKVLNQNLEEFKKICGNLIEQKHNFQKNFLEIYKESIETLKTKQNNYNKPKYNNFKNKN